MPRIACSTAMPQPHDFSIGCVRTLAFFFYFTAVAAAGEIRMRSEGASPGELIRLADVADLEGFENDAEAAQLAKLEIGPSPRDGQTRIITPREIRDLLDLHEISTAGLKIVGASETLIFRGSAESAKAIEPLPLLRETAPRNFPGLGAQRMENNSLRESSDRTGGENLANGTSSRRVAAASVRSDLGSHDAPANETPSGSITASLSSPSLEPLPWEGDRRMNRLVSAAGSKPVAGRSSGNPDGESIPPAIRVAEERLKLNIRQHLQKTVDRSADWKVDVKLPQETWRHFQAPNLSVRVSGGASPWTGTQKFQVVLNSPLGTVPLTLAAEVSLPDVVAVATRAIQAGETLQESDIALAPPPAGSQVRDVFRRTEEAVGRKSHRAFAAGQPLDSRFLKAPVLVRRNETIAVIARNGGVQVRIAAKAMDEGGAGDWISVQPLDRKETFTARVTGARQAEAGMK